MRKLEIAVAKDGDLLYSKGYGLADVEMKVAAGPETVYMIGSITKQITAATIMRLVEQGKISLDDPITKYLPDYPAQGNTVTIHHLLNHTSGIKGFRILAEENRQRFRMDLTYEEMTDLYGNQPFDFKPGDRFMYNNMAYYLLGEIIGQITGMSWYEYVEKELLTPLGLNETVYCDNKRVILNRAEGYDYDNNQLINANFVSPKVGGAAGTLCSTVSDLVRWDYLLYNGKVISEKSLDQMLSPTVLTNGDTINYGFGVGLGWLDNKVRIGHTGGANGFRTSLTYFPESQLTVVVLTNSGISNPLEVEKPIARAAFGIELKNLPLTEKEIKNYEGVYAYKSGKKERELKVFGENGRLKAQMVGSKRSFNLLFQGDDVFVPEIDDDRLIFLMENGRTEGFKLHEGKDNINTAKKIK